MIIVTGGAGFIGSNLVKALNQAGRKDIVVVDDLTDGTKFVNLVDLDIADYIDKDEFIARIVSGDHFEEWGGISAILHQGACSATTEWNGKFVMDVNYEYSKDLLHYCLEYGVQFIYASSAATYGGRNDNFIEERRFEQPLNVYGYSKFLFDEYVRRILPETDLQIVGLKYFNVYGPREQHKGSMASVAFHLNNQVLKGEIEYIPFPEHLKGRYQSFTQADLTKLRATGCDVKFRTVAEGVAEYMAWLNK